MRGPRFHRPGEGFSRSLPGLMAFCLVRKCTDKKAGHVQARAMMDEWTEELRCSRCRKIGIASLCQGSDLERPIVVLSVSNGFKVVNDRYGFKFVCESCDASALP